MVKVDLTNILGKEMHVYFCGTEYELSKNPRDKNNILIYNNENKIVKERNLPGSLEGVFISGDSLFEGEFDSKSYIITREEMKEFEKTHKGQFVQFNGGAQ